MDPLRSNRAFIDVLPRYSQFSRSNVGRIVHLVVICCSLWNVGAGKILSKNMQTKQVSCYIFYLFYVCHLFYVCYTCDESNSNCLFVCLFHRTLFQKAVTVISMACTFLAWMFPWINGKFSLSMTNVIDLFFSLSMSILIDFFSL